jgi:hypothetical protein
MIISHHYQFAFLKTNKTAGTSIEIALSKYCRDTDVITPISDHDEALRQSLGYRAPQNYLSSLRSYSLRDFGRLLLKRKKKRTFAAHMSAAGARAGLGQANWERYYKFCVERDPWDRVVSRYYWLHRTELRPTMTEFLDSGGALPLKRRGYGLYTIEGQIAVDRICRFENLKEELEEVRQRIGLPEPLVLPHAKPGLRKDKSSYRALLSDADRDLVTERFAEEIAMFGYQF